MREEAMGGVVGPFLDVAPILFGNSGVPSGAATGADRQRGHAQALLLLLVAQSAHYP